MNLKKPTHLVCHLWDQVECVVNCIIVSLINGLYSKQQESLFASVYRGKKHKLSKTIDLLLKQVASYGPESAPNSNIFFSSYAILP